MTDTVQPIEQVEDDKAERPKKPRGAGQYDANDLLNLVREERRRALSLEQDHELRAAWERGLNYFKGKMDDVPSLPNRSAAVSTDISDAVESILPDLLEIFIGGDDVAAFIPSSEQDEEAAQQETDFVTHVVMHDNPAFLNFHTVFQDALLQKVGIFEFAWEEDIVENDEEFEGKTLLELQKAMQDGEVSDVEQEEELTTDGQPLYSFSLKQKRDKSTVKIRPVAPEDFGIAPDSIRVSETSYCFMRSRPRAQDLKAAGFDPDLVDKLPMYGFRHDQQVQLSRDTAGEHLQQRGDDPDDMRVVEVFRHYIRLLGNDNKLHYWKVITNFDDTMILDYEEVDRVPFACGSPYLVSHRFFGRSLPDLLIEVQRIKTALIRALLDSGYFALNQRYEVNMKTANEYTLSDLLDNTPGMPVRVNANGTVNPLQSGNLGFDAYSALEYFSVEAELRSGVQRNAQGLKPDTMHETAAGALALLTAAQKRVRMIARCLAETCVKEMFLGVHALLRENSTSERIVKLRGKWAPISPSTWYERDSMTIEVGLGASGRQAELQGLALISQDLALIVQEQGGLSGPLVTAKNVHNLISTKAKKLGFKSPDEFITDPDSPEMQQQMAQRAQQPNPEMAKVQGELQIKQAQIQGDQQATAAKLKGEQELQGAKLTAEAQSAMALAQLEDARERDRMAAEFQLKRDQMEGEFALKRYQIDREVEMQREAAARHAEIKSAQVESSVHMGGEPG